MTPEIAQLLDEAYYAGRADERDLQEREQQEHARQLRELLLNRGEPGWYDQRLRALDATEAAGEAEYAAERARQGLVTYDRHRGLVEVAA